MESPLGCLDAVRADDRHLDPAIDPDASDLPKYRETRNIAHLKFREGAKPDLFRIRPIKMQSLIDVVEPQATIVGKWSMCFLLGCHEIVRGNGEVVKVKATRAPGGVMVADASWLDTVRSIFGAAAIMEMGRVAYARSQIAEGDEGPFF